MPKNKKSISILAIHLDLYLVLQQILGKPETYSDARLRISIQDSNDKDPEFIGKNFLLATGTYM